MKIFASQNFKPKDEKMLSWLKGKTKKTKNPKTTKRKLKPYSICHGKKDKKTTEISKYSNFKKNKLVQKNKFKNKTFTSKA
jgi:hypothetical protein